MLIGGSEPLAQPIERGPGSEVFSDLWATVKGE
jgi:hypothetical protein